MKVASFAIVRSINLLDPDPKCCKICTQEFLFGTKKSFSARCCRRASGGAVASFLFSAVILLKKKIKNDIIEMQAVRESRVAIFSERIYGFAT